MPYITIRQNGQDLGWRELDGAAVIGRQKECDICLIDLLMSRNHCRIAPAANDGWVLVDLESRNGTWHDETQVERIELTPGTRVRVGRTTITFHPGAPPAEGRYLSKASLRPSDPHEALAGTVMGMVVVDDGPAERPADPWAARRAARPRPTPRPLGAGESGIFPAITETSVAVHEPSSGACAILRESRLIDDGTRAVSDFSDELSVREPVAASRTRMLPRPILLEVQVAAEQEERAAALAMNEPGAAFHARAISFDEPRSRRRSWHRRLPFTQEAVIVILAFAMLGCFRFALKTSHPGAAVGQTVPSRPSVPVEPTFEMGLMAATTADLPPLSVTETPLLEPPPVSFVVTSDDDATSAADVSPLKALAISARHLRQSLTWDTLGGAVRDYQREVRRFILDAPSLVQTTTPATTTTDGDR